MITIRSRHASRNERLSARSLSDLALKNGMFAGLRGEALRGRELAQ